MDDEVQKIDSKYWIPNMPGSINIFNKFNKYLFIIYSKPRIMLAWVLGRGKQNKHASFSQRVHGPLNPQNGTVRQEYPSFKTERTRGQQD